MTRITKVQRELAGRLAAAHEAGAEYYAKHIEELLVAAHRHASTSYSDKAEAFEFISGFMAARQRRDEYLREKQQEDKR